VSVRKEIHHAALRIVALRTPIGPLKVEGLLWGYGYVALKLEGKMSFSVQVAAAKEESITVVFDFHLLATDRSCRSPYEAIALAAELAPGKSNSRTSEIHLS